MAALGLPWWLRGKESDYRCRSGEFDPCVGKIPWRRKWRLTPVFLPGKSRGQRSLEGHSSRDCERVGHDLVTEGQQLQLGLLTHPAGPAVPRPACPRRDPAVRQGARCRPGPLPAAQVAVLCMLHTHRSTHPSLIHPPIHNSLLNTYPVCMTERLTLHATLCQALLCAGGGGAVGKMTIPLVYFTC